MEELSEMEQQVILAVRQNAKEIVIRKKDDKITSISVTKSFKLTYSETLFKMKQEGLQLGYSFVIKSVGTNTVHCEFTKRVNYY